MRGKVPRDLDSTDKVNGEAVASLIRHLNNFNSRDNN